MFSRLFARGLLSASKNNHRSTYPYVNIVYPDDCYPKLNMFVSEQGLSSWEYRPVAHVNMNYTILPSLRGCRRNLRIKNVYLRIGFE
jgi:hypothetical protein